MREVYFYDYGGVSYLYLSKEHRLFFLYSLFWRGGRAGLMRQIANLLVGLEPTRRFESSPRRFYACVAQLVRAYPS